MREIMCPTSSGIEPVRLQEERVSLWREVKEERLEGKGSKSEMDWILIWVTWFWDEQVMEVQLHGVGSNGFQSESSGGGAWELEWSQE